MLLTLCALRLWFIYSCWYKCKSIVLKGSLKPLKPPRDLFRSEVDVAKTSTANAKGLKWEHRDSTTNTNVLERRSLSSIPKPDRRNGGGSSPSSEAKRRPERDSLESLTFSKTFIIDPGIRSNIDDVNLSEETKRALKINKGFIDLTPVQSQSFDLIFSGVDVVARSKTGSGKTLAFGLPLLEQLVAKFKLQSKPNGKPVIASPSVLILEPTRELAIQVTQELSIICKLHGIKVTSIYGGVSFDDQARTLRGGIDIIVATPGRVLDHITRQTIDISNIEHIVLDEGDTMLEMGFQKHVETIMANVKYPGELARSAAKKSLSVEDSGNEIFDDRTILSAKGCTKRHVQMLLFSATMAGWICKLTSKHMTSPVFLDAVVEGETRLPSTIEHVAFKLLEKRSLKAVSAAVQRAIVTRSAGGKTIVFTKTKVEADSLTASSELTRFRPHALHGDMSQGKRQTVIRQFRQGKIDVLIATDVASRGLDVDGVDLIIHTQLPDDYDTYVHRSGRTGRAGKSGTAVTIHSSTSTDLKRISTFENSLKFNYIRLDALSSSGQGSDSLSDATDAYLARRSTITPAAHRDTEFGVSQKPKWPQFEKGIKTANSVAANVNLCHQEEYNPSDESNDFDQIIGNWSHASLEERAAAEEKNALLRSKYLAEITTRITSDLTSDERERAKVLVERQNRKRDRRVLQAEAGISRSKARTMYSFNNL